MKHRVYKFFVDFEKEEKWLNEMAGKGFHMIDFSFPGRYLFEKDTPGKYIYRLELLKNIPSHLESVAYIEFMESTGAELVSTYLRWAWFRKKAEDGSFDLYTDHSSKIKHYQRIIWMIGIIGIINLICALVNFSGFVLSGLRYGYTPNALVSVFNFAVALVCLRAALKYYFKTKKLKKESQIHE